MSSLYFDEVALELGRRGLAIEEASYDERAFGSWHVLLSTSPRLRLTLDGRDGWLYVQKDSGHEDERGLRIWSDLWSSEGPFCGEPQDAVSTLSQFVDRQPSPG